MALKLFLQKEVSNMKKHLAIIGASYLQLPLIEKAKEMGYTTHVFAWAANDVGEKAADYFYPISIIEKEQILEVCEKIGICGICSIASDVAVITVNYVAEKMNLPGNTIASTGKCTNKHLMRMAFELNGDPSPKSFLVEEETNIKLLDLTYPAIVKPTDRSGSRGIYKVTSEKEILKALIVSKKESFEKKVLVEEYVEGQEYSVEHISYKGKHYFLALTKKYTTGAPHFIETGHMEPAPINDEILEKIKNIISHALDSLEIYNGASHSEIKIDNEGNIRIIEIGARMGGDCIGSDLVKYSTGYDFLKMVIQVACGETPDFTKVCQPVPVESIFIFNQHDVDKLHELEKYHPEKIIRIVDYHPENIGQTTDSSNRAGCYIRKV